MIQHRFGPVIIDRLSIEHIREAVLMLGHGITFTIEHHSYEEDAYSLAVVRFGRLVIRYSW